MPPEDERERLRQTFDRAAGRYDRARPGYPEALFDDLIVLAGLTPGDHLLEVGCATGLATRALARRGFRITCVELGAELAAAARRNLAEWPVEVVQGQFEQWRPAESYGLVYAATARASGHGGLETQAVVRRDQAAARDAAGPFGAAALGSGAARRPAA